MDPCIKASFCILYLILIEICPRINVPFFLERCQKSLTSWVRKNAFYIFWRWPAPGLCLAISSSLILPLLVAAASLPPVPCAPGGPAGSSSGSSETYISGSGGSWRGRTRSLTETEARGVWPNLPGVFLQTAL